MKISTLLFDINNIFIPHNIEKITQHTEFMKRHSKIPIDVFSKAVRISLLGSPYITYEVIASKINILSNGLNISKQAVGNRVKQSIPFLHSIYNRMFSKPCHQILNNFDDVKIIDSTTISLPDNVKDYYKGIGGKNFVSALKLQI